MAAEGRFLPCIAPRCLGTTPLLSEQNALASVAWLNPSDEPEPEPSLLA